MKIIHKTPNKQAAAAVIPAKRTIAPPQPRAAPKKAPVAVAVTRDPNSGRFLKLQREQSSALPAAPASAAVPTTTPSTVLSSVFPGHCMGYPSLAPGGRSF